MMTVVRTIIGWAVGLGLFAMIMTVIIPGYLDKRCKERWEPRGLAATWIWETGCMVQVGRFVTREEYVILPDPTVRK